MNNLERILLGFTLFMISCGGPSEINTNIKGKYKFTYPSGQVEILYMKDGYSFLQEIYVSEKEYMNQDEPLFRNAGRWISHGANLEFENWLSICYLSRMTDSILPQPEKSTLMNVSWYDASGKSLGKIYIYDEPEYVLNKIE